MTGPVQPRDEEGWRIPKPGTKSRRIYDLIKQGKKPREIIAEIGGNRGTLGVLLFKMRHPDKANKMTTAWKPGGDKFRGFRDANGS